MRARTIIKINGGKSIDVWYTCEAIGPASDLEWGEIETYGAASEVGGDYLLNHDGTCAYGEHKDHAEIEAFVVLGKGGPNTKQGKEPRTFKQFRGKMQGVKPEMGFRKMKTGFAKPADGNEIRTGDRPA